MKKTFRKIHIWISYTFAGFLILSYLSAYINPNTFSLPQFFGLIFPYLLLVNIVLLIYGIFRKSKLTLISFITIALGINNIVNFVSIGNKSVPEGINSLKILSYNVRLFNLYDWIKDKNTVHNIFEIIKEENADIICLQEFYSNSGKANFQDSIIKIQGTKSYLISYRKKGKYSGNAIFSRFPIVNEGMVNVGTSNQKCIFADIAIKKDTIRIYSIHLASVHFSQKDYDFIDNKYDSEKKINNFFSMYSKMSNAYKIRAGEADIISSHITQSPYKTIVCGDFNDVPLSYTYHKIKEDFKDSFKESGLGILSTYAHDFLFFRIDYILHSKNLKAYDYKRIKKQFSDHYPISCKITFK